MNYDGIGVFRPGIGLGFYTYQKVNGDLSGTPIYDNFYVVFGEPSDIPIAGDWDGDGYESIGVYTPSNGVFSLSNSLVGHGVIDYEIAFGEFNNWPLIGGWTCFGAECQTKLTGVGYYSRGTFYLRQDLGADSPVKEIDYTVNGNASLTPGIHIWPLSGHWSQTNLTYFGTATPTPTVTLTPYTLCGRPQNLSGLIVPPLNNTINGGGDTGSLDGGGANPIYSGGVTNTTFVPPLCLQFPPTETPTFTPSSTQRPTSTLRPTSSATATRTITLTPSITPTSTFINPQNTKVAGARKLLALLCQYADKPAFTSVAITRIQTQLQTVNFPGAGHFWSNQSYGNLQLLSEIRGPYTIHNSGSYTTNKTGLIQDCLNAGRNTDINLDNYPGYESGTNGSTNLVVFLNADLPGRFTGEALLPYYYSTAPVRYYPAVMISELGSIQGPGTLAHELGHMIADLPHSGGPYISESFSEYDSWWDVMSDSDNGCSMEFLRIPPLPTPTLAPTPTFVGNVDPRTGTCTQPPVSGFGRLVSQWVDPKNVLNVQRGKSYGVVLSHVGLNVPSALTVITIPISPFKFYIIEARKPLNSTFYPYDQNMIHSGIVIHLVDLSGAPNTKRIHVLDIDVRVGSYGRICNDGKNSTTRDEGSIWIHGSVFIDDAEKLLVSVNSEEIDGYKILISFDSALPIPAPKPGECR
jgi:hypothetical protein